MLKQLKNNLIHRTQARFPGQDVSIALRYLPIVEAVTSEFPPPAKILEIGPGEFGILPYLPPSYSITGVDVDFGSGSARRMTKVKSPSKTLPFADHSFDVVISVDTLEHIPPADRLASLSEMLRVTNQRLFLAFPEGPAAAWCDSVLDRYFRLTHKGQPFPYLKEHLDYGLPSLSQVKADIKTGHVEVKNNTHILLWLFMLFLGFSQVGVFTSIFILLLWLVPILRYINFYPSYRKLVIVTFTPQAP